MSKIISDLNYLLTYDGIIYLVKGYYHPPQGVFAYPVFWPDKDGQRLHPTLGRYTKNVSDFNKEIFELHPEYRHSFIPVNTPLVSKSHITKIFHPRDKIKQFVEKEKGSIWYQIFKYLTKKTKIPKEDIGILGSYLVDMNRNINGKHIKDVDFAIYGLKNLQKIKQSIENLTNHFGFSHISKDHILWHKEKFGKHFDTALNSFEKTLANKWSSIQVSPGLLTTLRFVYKQNEIPPNPITTPVVSSIQIKGKVIEDVGTNFVPRVFQIKSGSKIYTVATYFWAFQSCVRNGNQILVTGSLHQDALTISIDKSSHGIKILS